MQHYDVIIIGAGASGLMCAAHAARRSRRVLLLDSSNKVGKKILMSGGGRCNFTNLDVTPKNYLSNNPRFCISALKRYTQWHFLELVEKYKIPFEERKHGQLFCLNSAKDILQMLLSECQQAGVEIRTHCQVSTIKTAAELTSQTAIKQASAQYFLQTSLSEFSCESLVIATGGLSIPTMGATGFGYEVARQFGHTILPTRAGLVPFTFTDDFKVISERLSGLAIDSQLSCESTSFHEAILFTHRGLSGPAALQISNYWHAGEKISLDLLPDIPEQTLIQELISLKAKHPKGLLRNQLNEKLAKNLVLELQNKLWLKDAETMLANIADATLEQIAINLKHWEQKPAGTEGYRTAEVTLGGVDTTEVSSKTMESTQQKGLFFIGEVLDVTGHLGGYNFQWAWASGAAAGEYV